MSGLPAWSVDVGLRDRGVVEQHRDDEERHDRVERTRSAGCTGSAGQLVAALAVARCTHQKIRPQTKHADAQRGDRPTRSTGRASACAWVVMPCGQPKRERLRPRQLGRSSAAERAPTSADHAHGVSRATPRRTATATSRARLPSAALAPAPTGPAPPARRHRRSQTTRPRPSRHARGSGVPVDPGSGRWRGARIGAGACAADGSADRERATSTRRPRRRCIRSRGEALLAALDDGWADPARLYGAGRRARQLLDAAREADRRGARRPPGRAHLLRSAARQAAHAGGARRPGRPPPRRPAGSCTPRSSTRRCCTPPSGTSAAGGEATSVPVDRRRPGRPRRAGRPRPADRRRRWPR